jgi:hypothetical protein
VAGATFMSRAKPFSFRPSPAMRFLTAAGLYAGTSLAAAMTPSGFLSGFFIGVPPFTLFFVV